MTYFYQWQYRIPYFEVWILIHTSPEVKLSISTVPIKITFIINYFISVRCMLMRSVGGPICENKSAHFAK